MKLQKISGDSQGASRPRRIGREQRGSVYVEYLVIALFAGILVAKVLGPEVGGAIVTEYSQRRAILYSTTP